MSSEVRPAADHDPSSRRLLAAVVAITAAALAARLAFLGQRVFHWDEGRVAYWILQYVETGEWSYRPIVHGPFLPRVNAVVFEVLGASDFSARLVVAVVGGFLPLAAWLYRNQLRNEETVALALLFAANPVLLYYSRFMRNDVLLASFMLFALGFFVRTHETRRPRYLYAGVAMLALAFTTKGNVLVYLAAWVAAAALLLDHRLFRAHDRGDDWLDTLEARARRTVDCIQTWRIPIVTAVVEFASIVVFFYAPRPDLWQALTAPSQLPSVLQAATVGVWREFAGLWLLSGYQDDNLYLEHFATTLELLAAGAIAVVAFAFVGFIEDRYAESGPRDLVSFAMYWGALVLLLSPLVATAAVPWSLVHVVAPLAIPAAAGIGLVYRWGEDAWQHRDHLGVAVTVLLLALASVHVGATAMHTSYDSPADRENDLVQYGQPATGLGPTLDRANEAIRGNDGIDVVYYSTGDDSNLVVSDEHQNDRPPAADGWYDRLPLPWYFEQVDAEVTSTDDSDTVEQYVAEEQPPVVVVPASARSDVASSLEAYEAHEHQLTLWGTNTVIYIHPAALE